MFSGTAWNMNVSTKQANLKQISSKKKRQQFLWLLNSLGGPLDILCFGISMEFFCTFFPDLHFSMQTHSLVEHIMLCLKSGVSK